MDAAAVGNPRAQSVLHACRKQIDVPVDSTSCFLSVESTLRGGYGHDRTYTCETAGQNGTPLFILNRMTVDGQIYATWMKNHGELPRFNLAPEYQIHPEIRDLDKEIYTKNSGSSCIVSFTDSIHDGSKQAAMRSGNCAFTWHEGQDLPDIKRVGETCPWDSPGSEPGDFLKIEDESRHVIETTPASLQQEAVSCPEVICPLPEPAKPCDCPLITCPELLDAGPDFSRIYVVALGAAAGYLGYRTYLAAKDLLYPVKIDDEQVDETGRSLEPLRDPQPEKCKTDLSAWVRPAGFGLASAFCLAFALKA